LAEANAVLMIVIKMYIKTQIFEKFKSNCYPISIILTSN